MFHQHIHFLLFHMFYKTTPSLISQWRELIGVSAATFLVLFFVSSMFTVHALESSVMKDQKNYFFKRMY